MIRSAGKLMGVRRATTTVLFLVGLAIILALVLVGASRAYATPATFLVDSTADPGDGVCDADECTLREAINAANANNNPTETDTITFDISGTGPHTITPVQSLPTVTQAVSINGYSEPDSSANTLAKSSAGTNARIAIVIDGSSTSQSFGILTAASNVVVKGLAIHSFDGTGINVRSSNTITENVRIEGNFIGTDSGGIQDLGNGGGVNLSTTTNITVGGDTPGARNLISGNSFGVRAISTSGTKVLGNLIGTQKDGKSSALANDDSGVYVQNGTVIVGGSLAGSANTIAYNTGDGVYAFGSGTRARVLRNSIFRNGGQGIDLANVSANDHCDPDTDDNFGTPNGGQNFPDISSAQTSASGTTIQGSLDSVAGKTYVVRFFANPGGTDIEGKGFLGKMSVTTDSTCVGSFTFTTTAPPGKYITATATDPNGNTSEFSAPRQVVSQ